MMETIRRLNAADWLAAEPLASVLASLDRDGEEARIAGGAVRDALLGHSPGDIDIATTATPREVIKRAEAASWKPVPTGLEHGTVTVVAYGKPFEVTTLRRDVATDGRRAVVAFTRDWAEDAGRRDLTINGLFLDRDGVVHDHVGGLGDLDARRVRFIGDPRARIREDFLRTLRFFRFHARFGAGAIDPDGLAAAISERAGLARLSRERVRGEILKLLVAPHAPAAVETMAQAGLLGPLLGSVPRLARLRRVAALDAAAPDALLRLAALAQAVAEDGERLCDRLRLSNDEAKRLAAIGDGAPRMAPRSGEAAGRRALYAYGAQAFVDRVRLAWADAGAQPDDPDWSALLALPERWTPPKPPFAAADFLERGVAAGPVLGKALRAAEDFWIAAEFPTGRDEVGAILAAARDSAERGST